MNRILKFMLSLKRNFQHGALTTFIYIAKFGPAISSDNIADIQRSLRISP